jgi:hypothetical protein
VPPPLGLDSSPAGESRDVVGSPTEAAARPSAWPMLVSTLVICNFLLVVSILGRLVSGFLSGVSGRPHLSACLDFATGLVLHRRSVLVLFLSHRIKCLSFLSSRCTLVVSSRLRTLSVP